MAIKSEDVIETVEEILESLKNRPTDEELREEYERLVPKEKRVL